MFSANPMSNDATQRPGSKREGAGYSFSAYLAAGIVLIVLYVLSFGPVAAQYKIPVGGPYFFPYGASYYCLNDAPGWVKIVYSPLFWCSGNVYGFGWATGKWAGFCGAKFDILMSIDDHGIYVPTTQRGVTISESRRQYGTTFRSSTNSANSQTNSPATSQQPQPSTSSTARSLDAKDLKKVIDDEGVYIERAQKVVLMSGGMIYDENGDLIRYADGTIPSRRAQTRLHYDYYNYFYRLSIEGSELYIAPEEGAQLTAEGGYLRDFRDSAGEEDIRTLRPLYLEISYPYAIHLQRCESYMHYPGWWSSQKLMQSVLDDMHNATSRDVAACYVEASFLLDSVYLECAIPGLQLRPLTPYVHMDDLL